LVLRNREQGKDINGKERGVTGLRRGVFKEGTHPSKGPHENWGGEIVWGKRRAGEVRSLTIVINI